VRCDIIANGIIQAVREVGIDLPLVVRLEGNRAEEAAAILAKSGLNLTSVSGFLVAAETAVKLAQKD
jgi:succinyl-CoA synthetase beta subunit